MQNQECLILSQTYYFSGGGVKFYMKLEVLELLNKKMLMAEAIKNGPLIPHV